MVTKSHSGAVFSGITLLVALLAAGCAQPAVQTVTPAAPDAASQATASTATQPSGADRIEILFANGSDRLTPEAGRQLDVAARLFRDVRPVVMFSTGYSDGRGGEFDNIVLSAKRARTVKAALISRGVPADQVLIRAFGESDPVSPSAPDASDNRRVLVTWRAT